MSLSTTSHLLGGFTEQHSNFVASLAVGLKALASRRMLVLEGLGQSYERVVGLHLAACAAELRARQARNFASTGAACDINAVT